MKTLDLKSRRPSEAWARVGHGKPSRRSCLRSCPRIHAGIHKAKANILAEAHETPHLHDRMLRLALNEAEALAWQTAYPHLFFPTLAAEKVRAVQNWSRHQRTIQRLEPLALAA